jgi:hypothetical protein
MQVTPKVIWLQPWCQECEWANEDRTWCKDNVWEEGCECGQMPVKYELAEFQPLPVETIDDD